MITNNQAPTPSRADPAAGQNRLRCLSLGHDSHGADQAARLGGPNPQGPGNLLRGQPPLPQHTYAIETLIGLHNNRS
jgi:hypothetical protein